MAGFGSLATMALDLGIAGAALAPPPDFLTAPQEQDYWCWAAVSASVLEARDLPAMRQCEIVTARWGASCPPHPPINKPASLDEVLGPLLQLPADWHGSQFLKDEAHAYARICGSIDAGKPVPILIAWDSGQTPHYVCAFGYARVQNEPALWIFDPSKAWAQDGNRRLRTLAAMRRYSEAPNKPSSFGFWAEAYLLE